MIVVPAVDILDHRVVQLVGGVPGTERVVLPDPVAVAEGWEAEGARRLHVVDLDSAMGKGHNAQAIRRIVQGAGIPVQVGGGIRSSEVVEYYLDCGADRVIVGTKGLKDPAWLRRMAERRPGRLVLALDMRGGRVQAQGWREGLPLGLEDVFATIADMPLAGVLYTNVDVEGQGAGIDAGAVRAFMAACPHPTIVSGGITTERDLEALEGMGVREAVVGLALYTGKLNHSVIRR
ncbi:MAG TPA: 1-(5-phosphoribosyl)-5-[(5-phosphoribosylamino)methylideneamino] imidazole-4-carboxamide isomerase [Methanomassiliicoccales archaeon]|nr:1-(5-phosphoribosyl)-5-[(5-phosphoribosylamino)methylideneamino] imidazole-4-carboxamide isomerase [Methanomassiliicoccales archaeon]